MPFKSKAQAGYLFANQPQVAQEFASKTPNMGALPKRAPDPKQAKRTALLKHMKGC